MLTLYSFASHFCQPSASSFCVKAMCLLEMAQVPYQIDFSADVQKMPLQKLPVLKDGATLIPDSDQIRSYLEKNYKADFDTGLSMTDKAYSQALIRMAEEHLYFGMVADRWLNDANWVHVKAAFFSDIPRPIRGIITGRIRKYMKGNLDGHGLGRFNDLDRLARISQDIIAIELVLGTKPFLFGDRPTAADASVAPVIAGIANSPEPTALRNLVRQKQTLMTWVANCENTIYPRQTPHAVAA